MTAVLKLRIELIPLPSWYNNLRKRGPRSVWDKIRKDVYAKYGYKCGIGGGEGRLECHEIWDYNDDHHVQKLAGFIALCDLCHHGKHVAKAEGLARRGELNYEKLVEHFSGLIAATEKHLRNIARRHLSHGLID